MHSFFVFLLFFPKKSNPDFSLDYLRVEALHPTLVLKDARMWPMKLYLYTANGLRTKPMQ
jgi:hypothetical protein